jgi:hypothetical protein
MIRVLQTSAPVTKVRERVSRGCQSHVMRANNALSLISFMRARPGEMPTNVPWNFAEWFVLSQTFLPALLYLPGSQPFRVPIRMASYAITLAALLYFWPNKRRLRPHPAVPWLVASMIYLAIMLAHPTTNSLLSGAAQIGIYFSVLAPVIWAPKLVESPARLDRLLWLLLICNGLSSAVGVLQVYDPDRWMPVEFSSNFLDNGGFGLAPLTYQGPDGRTIIRPPGLGDAPGAVSGAGVLALFLGLVLVTNRTFLARISASILAGFGAAAVFLTLVRSSFVIGLVMMTCYVYLKIRQGRVATAMSISLLGIATVAIAFIGALALGGESVSERFSTLFDSNPIDLYYDSRGNQVLSAFSELLPEYPFGAGLGRWGMMYEYFGDHQNIYAPPIWAEIQWPAWIVDGGFILVFLSCAALLATLRHGFLLSIQSGDGRTRSIAATITSVNLGFLALTFSYPVFASTMGMQFWFLAGSLQGVLSQYAKQNSPRVRAVRHCPCEPPAR